MAKRKAKFQEEFVSGVPEFEEDFNELMAAGDALEELVTVEETQEPEKEIRMKVMVVRAYVFARPDLTSRSVTALSFGNQVFLLEDREDAFVKIRIPRSPAVEGFILRNKVKRI